MKTSISPWIYQLKKERKTEHLREDISTDVVIVGAGIAGISTAFFTLKNTHKHVVIVEKNVLAHGATGHNAGQVVSYFERPFAELVKEFGLEIVVEGQRSIDSAWSLLEAMYTEAGLNIPFSRFLGHAGFSSKEQVLNMLKDIDLKIKGGLQHEEMLISKNADFIGSIPKQYKKLYKLVPHEEILERLETKKIDFVACISHTKGCINSALFCQEIYSYLAEKYKNRFRMYEDTNVKKVILRHDHALLDTETHTIKAGRVVLCTNGFEKFSIINETGLQIDTRFHHLVTGVVGYMSGYLETYDKPPTAVSYITNPDYSDEDPYFYLTRRMYEYEGKKDYNLICVGGPEFVLPDRKNYMSDFDYPEKAQEDIDTFVKGSYDPSPNKSIDYKFTWHGLMGYTPKRVRLIGPEPKNPILLYNLGCNGVGILPSIFGGQRISYLLSGKSLGKSLFDVWEDSPTDQPEDVVAGPKGAI